MNQIFTSYSRKDKDFVRRLSDALASKKRDAWIDWKDIPLTVEWQQEILTNIEAAENFLFVISPESVASRNCRKEIDHAIANHKRMFPIVRQSVPEDSVPDASESFNGSISAMTAPLKRGSRRSSPLLIRISIGSTPILGY